MSTRYSNDNEYDDIANLMTSGHSDNSFQSGNDMRGSRYERSSPLPRRDTHSSCMGCESLTREVDSLRTTVVTLVSRIETLEQTSQLFPQSEREMGKSAVRSLSPGGLGYADSRPRVGSSSSYGQMGAGSSRLGFIAPRPVSTSAAASLSARLHKSTGGIRTAAAKASASSSPSVPSFKDTVNLTDGVTLVKDRRLLDQSIASHTANRVFKDITERERLQAFPVIGKGFNAVQVYNAIIEAFRKQNHDLVRDGQKGYEFCRLLNHSARLQTLRSDPPSITLTGVELATEYKRNKCFIVVRSDKKFDKYDPLLHQLLGTSVDDDSPFESADDSDIDLPDITQSDRAWKKCAFCKELIGIKEHAAHEYECGIEWKTQKDLRKELEDLRKQRVAVKEEAETAAAALNEANSLPKGSVSLQPPAGSCACGEADADGGL
ncbi:unnamed protein product [Tilletia caries]|nr:hypothetical protein CF335_g8616 [Tilletia laevis]CAD6954858.1 unnamed protein product [Tilletia caries]